MVRGGVLTLAIFALVAVPAGAQTAPVEDGTNVGGRVDGSLELILPQTTNGLASFKRAGTFTYSFNVMTTTTETAAQLAIVDGQATSGSKLGHLSSGSKRLPDPLEARVGNVAFQPLDESLDPFHLAGPMSRKTSKITLRQKVRSKPKGTYRAVLLVSASSETP
jgi:hypothetical protein